MESYDISKTFKTTQSQLSKIHEVERILKIEQSRAIRYLLDVGYAGFTAVRSPDIAGMQDMGFWKIPLFEELSPEAREATFEIWKKELGGRVDNIQRMNERFIEKNEKDYETLLRKNPPHACKWGSGDVVKIPITGAEEIKNLKVSLWYLETHVGAQKEYEIHHKKKLPIYGSGLSQRAKDELLWECMRLPGHDFKAPSIVGMATTRKAKPMKEPTAS